MGSMRTEESTMGSMMMGSIVKFGGIWEFSSQFREDGEERGSMGRMGRASMGRMGSMGSMRIAEYSEYEEDGVGSISRMIHAFIIFYFS